MKNLNIRTLKAFVIVAQEGNVSRASTILNLTQPAVSLQLKRLSDETGITLFNRTSHGLELTPDGALLAAKAEHIIAAVTDFGQTAQHLVAQVSGKLRIGTIIDPEFTRLGALLKAIVESGPNIETELRHGMSGNVLTRLVHDEIDVGFYLGATQGLDIADTANHQPLYTYKKLSNLTYRVIAPPAFSDLVRGKSWSELAKLPWIGTQTNSVHHRILKPLFSGLGVKQNVVASVDQEMSMLAMVHSGVGLSLCRDSIALHEQQAHGLAIADQVEISTALSFVCLKARAQSASIAHSFDLVDRIWA